MAYIQEVNPGLQVETQSLSDPVGPAGTSDEINAIVLSPENSKAIEKINTIREKAGLKALSAIVIEYATDTKGTVSSTRLREAEAARRAAA